MYDLLIQILALIVLSAEEFTAFTRKDQAMLAKVYESYKKNIKTYFLVKTFGNRHISEDLTHDTFCSVIRSAPGLKSPDYMDYWIFSIAKRRLIDYQRSLYRRKSIDKEIEREHKVSNGFAGSIEDDIDRKQKALLLTMAVEKLPPDYLEIYDLRYKQGKKRAEIAEKLGKTEKAIEGVLARLNKRMKSDMLKLAENFF